MEESIRLSSFQDFIRDRYYKTDHARGTPATFLWFIEEVGELATALQHAGGDAPNHDDDDTHAAARQNLEEEFADVLAWLCTLANINNVDLSHAVHQKYLAGPGPVGHK